MSLFDRIFSYIINIWNIKIYKYLHIYLLVIRQVYNSFYSYNAFSAHPHTLTLYLYDYEYFISQKVSRKEFLIIDDNKIHLKDVIIYIIQRNNNTYM